MNSQGQNWQLLELFSSLTKFWETAGEVLHKQFKCLDRESTTFAKIFLACRHSSCTARAPTPASQNSFEKRESLTERCVMCGMSTQQRPSSLITLFERPGQKRVTRRWDNTRGKKESGFLCIEITFLREFSEKITGNLKTRKCFLQRATNLTFSKFRSKISKKILPTKQF